MDAASPSCRANAHSYPRVALGDIFSIKRGIATGDNGFFIVSEQQARELGFSCQFLRPILRAHAT